MYLYNEAGDEAIVDKEQVQIMLDAGWTKEPPVAENETNEADGSEEEQVESEKSVLKKKIIRK